MIVEVIICFILATLISFIGSVQFGPVNLRVIQAAYNNGLNSALIVTLGGIIPEIVYSSIAIWCSWALLSNPIYFKGLQLIAVPFFLISGISLILKKATLITDQPIRRPALFASGLIAGMLNPMLFTFWFMVTNFLVTGTIIELDTWPNRIAFATGTAFGALLLLILFAWLTKRNRQFLERTLSGKINKLVGVIFIILAVIQFYTWFQ